MPYLLLSPEMDPFFHFSKGALAQGLGDPVVSNDDLFWILSGRAV